MSHYLLKVERFAGSEQFTEAHVIEASDIQKAKYHYHRTLKDFGYTDTQIGGKHQLESPLGSLVDILTIRPIAGYEVDVMKDYLPQWTKV